MAPQIVDQDELSQRICCQCLEILNNVNTLRQVARRNSEFLIGDEAAPDPLTLTHPLPWNPQQLHYQHRQSLVYMVPHQFIQMPAVYNTNPETSSCRNVSCFSPLVACHQSESGDSSWQMRVDKNVNGADSCELGKLSIRANQIQWNRNKSAENKLDSTFETLEFESQEGSDENETDKEIAYFIVFKPQDSE